jgi:N-acetylglutamate synthase-like GNAT family acetyltransferase
MIVEVCQDRLEEVCKYVYELNKNKENQCRPFKSDVILAEIYEKFANLVFNDNDKLLISVNDDLTINGVLGLFTELDESFLQAFCGVYAHNDYMKVGNEFISFLEKKYSGMNMMFAFPKENEQGISLMNKHKFNKIEDAVIYELTSFINASTQDRNIINNNMISREKVIQFYKEQQEDVYWTIDKILFDESKWVIKHYVEDNQILGSAYCRIYNSYSAEIFGMLSVDNLRKNVIEKSLVEQISIECQERGIANVTFFSDLSRHSEIAEKIGFIEVDSHLTFERKL